MRDINLDTAPARTTILSYGAMRSGKTRWAATWPRPLFLSEATEGGWTTMRNMSPDAFFEPGRKPKVWAIEKAADLIASLAKIEPMIASGEIMTVVIDSITFYSDLYYSNLVTLARNAGKQPDLRQVYGNLGDHLRYVREQYHGLLCNVIWLALEKAPNEENQFGGPMIPGQSAQKFAAGCDYILYHRVFQRDKGLANSYEIRSRGWERYVAGGRDEGLLPDPIGYMEEHEDGSTIFVPDCTYRTFAEALALPTVDLKTIAPTITPIVAAIKPVTASIKSAVASSGNGAKPQGASAFVNKPQTGRTSSIR